MENNRSELVRVIDGPSSVEQFTSQMREALLGKLFNSKKVVINVMVNLQQDKSDSSITYPVTEDFNVPGTYFMLFQEVKWFMFNIQNHLSTIDHFIYIELVCKFAKDQQFTTSTSLWRELESEAARLGRNYKRDSIRQSFYKIVKSQLIIKVSPDRSVYAINKALAFHGDLSHRPELIKQDFHKATMTDAKSKDTK